MCTKVLQQGLIGGPFGGVAGAIFPNETKKLNESFNKPLGGAIALAAPKTTEKVNKNLKKISDFTKPIIGSGVAHLS
tara:strand:- start:512 stop:742 length:231 start_codon:yes stop_codon:yes gene_type:complete